MSSITPSSMDSSMTESLDGESIQSESSNKIEIYLTPMDESLSLVALDGHSLNEEPLEEPFNLSAILPLAFTALI